jgi:DNA primase
VLVEGQLDALRCWSVGLKTAIAPQGTSITDGQLALLRRYHPQVECFFDSDSAGQKAALRFLPMALKAGLEVRFLMLAGAEKLDPDLLFLEKGLAAYDEVKRGSLSAMDFACRSLLPGAATASAEQKSRAASELFAIIVQTDSDDDAHRASSAEIAAIHLRTSRPARLQRDLRSLRQRGKAAHVSPARIPRRRPQRTPPPRPAVKAADTSNTPEQHLLLLPAPLRERCGTSLATQAMPHDWVDTAHSRPGLLARPHPRRGRPQTPGPAANNLDATAWSRRAERTDSWSQPCFSRAAAHRRSRQGRPAKGLRHLAAPARSSPGCGK